MENTPRKILVTGATGLLGVPLVMALRRSGMRVIAAGHSRYPVNGDINIQTAVDDPDSVAKAVRGTNPDHIVHTAAVRSPEECLTDPERAYRINTVAVEWLAELCRESGIGLTYISTDYVFPGTEPPYTEASPVSPVNMYGRTKLAGEFAARSVPGHLVARIPALWGLDADDPKANQKPFVDAFRRGAPFPVENKLIRHFTLADDIAAGIAFCVNENKRGTVHLSAEERQTKADFAKALALLHGFDAGLVENAGLPVGSDIRPQDPSLDTTLYRSFGGPKLRGLTEVVEEFMNSR